MAVMRNSIIFGGVDSADFGIYIGGEGTFNAPKRDVEMISIPGRNGAFALDKGRFENIEVTYSAFNFEPDLDTFSAQLEAFRNAICSQQGYQRLTDTFHPDEYRMAAYIDGLEIKPVNFNTASTFDIVFDCKPQRFLTSGEEPITIGEWHETETASGSIASFEAESGDAVKSLVADIEPIQSLNGYDKPWSGGNGKNKLPTTATTQTINGITFTVNADGTIKVNGTATADTQITVGRANVSGGSYTFSSGVNTGSINTYYARYVARDSNGTAISIAGSLFIDVYDIETTKTLPDNVAFVDGYVGVKNGITVNNLVFKPMIRLATETDATFAPYSNICPISGYDEVNVSVCGVNVWDEEWELGTYDIVNGQKTASNNHIRCKNPVSVVPNTEYHLNTNGYNINVCYMDENIEFISNFNSVADVTRTTPQNCHYIVFNMAMAYGTTYNHDISINYPSTDTSYHAYNGNTYTTDLSGTRYGGTLDVASGVLTVTDVAVDLGSLTWEIWPGYTSIFRCGLPSGCKTVGNQGVPNWLCSAYVVTSGVSVSSTVGAIGQLHASYVLVNNPSYTDASAFKTAMTGQTLVYELAAPTTVQLTAEEVELLIGLNQVWANSGDVSVEYGTAPNVLVNPTLFESSPMLEVEGYGSININDDTVAIASDTIGWTIVAPKKTLDATSGSCTFPFDDSLANSGDDIRFNGGGRFSNITLEAKFNVLGIVDGIVPHTDPTGIEGGWSYSSSSTNTWLVLRASFPYASFDYGTQKTIGGTITFTPNFTDSTSKTIPLSVSLVYGGGNEFTLNWSTTLPSGVTFISASVTSWQIELNSSKSALGFPLYIDLDIGEAYKIEDGTVVSINNAVTIPAELPKLKSGANEITYDNTIADLKVVPRWWRI